MSANGLLEAVERVGRKIPLPATTLTPKSGDGRTRTAKLRDRHHMMARMMAAGMPDEQVCRQFGVPQSHLDMLRDQTPAFKELLIQYSTPEALARRNQLEDYYDIMEGLRNFTALALRDKILAEAEDLSVSELTKVMSDLSDRTGFSKNLINTVINTTLAERLEAQRRRRAPAGAGEGDGGASSPRAVGSSAPPLLELQATPVTEHPGRFRSDPLMTDPAPYSQGKHRRPK